MREGRSSGASLLSGVAFVGEGLYRALELGVDGVGDVDGPGVGRRAAGVNDDALAVAVGIPGFHRCSLVGSGEGGKDGGAGVDLAEIAFDDLGLVSLRLPAKVAPHRIYRLPAGVLNECRGAPAVLVGVGRAGEIHPPHSPSANARGVAHVPTVRIVDTERRATDFVALGHSGSAHYAGLETFANPGVSQVEMSSDELAAVCPVTGQPDLYMATIEYRPQALCLESKSLKLYLVGFRNEPHFCEALAVKIRDDVAAALELPSDQVTVTLKQKARGGISISATS
jgi:7-cyano-7-deazaguanine reductase